MLRTTLSNRVNTLNKVVDVFDSNNQKKYNINGIRDGNKAIFYLKEDLQKLESKSGKNLYDVLGTNYQLIVLNSGEHGIVEKSIFSNLMI